MDWHEASTKELKAARDRRGMFCRIVKMQDSVKRGFVRAQWGAFYDVAPSEVFGSHANSALARSSPPASVRLAAARSRRVWVRE